MPLPVCPVCGGRARKLPHAEARCKDVINNREVERALADCKARGLCRVGTSWRILEIAGVKMEEHPSSTTANGELSSSRFAPAWAVLVGGLTKHFARRTRANLIRALKTRPEAQQALLTIDRLAGEKGVEAFLDEHRLSWGA